MVAYFCDVKIFLSRNAPTELFADILKQKQACNGLLEKRNDLIATLEAEVRLSDAQYKTLVEEYHENVAVLASRMGFQIQALEKLVRSERGKINEALARERDRDIKVADTEWSNSLDGLMGESRQQVEERLEMLRLNEESLDGLILGDAEAFTDMKHTLEDKIRQLSDQLQFMNATQSLNEVTRIN